MIYDGVTTKKVVEELQSIENYKIDKIFEPDKNTIILGAYGQGKNVAILACISAQNYRLHLTNKNYKNPVNAMNFCMLLRKHILGYRIKRIYNKDLERIIFIELENEEYLEYSETTRITNKTIIVELMGKHSNIILTDGNGIIIESLRHTFVEKNAQRDIYPTARYIMPKASSKVWEHKDEEIEKVGEFSLNYAIDDFYYQKEVEEKFKNSRNQILTIILSALKKYEKRLKNIELKLLECEGKEKYKLYGELITANLYRLPKYNIEKIELENYYDDNKIVEIVLDKKYTPGINAKRFFKKYTKLKNAEEVVNIQKQETIEDINYLESIVYEIESTEKYEDIEEIYEEIFENEIFQNKKKYEKNKKVKKLTKNKFAKFNPLKYLVDGYTIYVGRNNKENDYLTNKFANKNDIWFHTKEIHGSHVILKTNANEEVPESVLYEAAKFAAKHSKAKNSTKIPVDFCYVKYVKKIPGNKPGLVIYSNNRTIYVD